MKLFYLFDLFQIRNLVAYSHIQLNPNGYLEKKKKRKGHGFSTQSIMLLEITLVHEMNQTSKIVSQMRIYIGDCVVQFSEITKE